MRPAPPPLDPAQYLNAHRLMTLKLDLRSHASRNTTRQTRRRSSDAYVEAKSPAAARGAAEGDDQAGKRTCPQRGSTRSALVLLEDHGIGQPSSLQNEL